MNVEGQVVHYIEHTYNEKTEKWTVAKKVGNVIGIMLNADMRREVIIARAGNMNDAVNISHQFVNPSDIAMVTAEEYSNAEKKASDVGYKRIDELVSEGQKDIAEIKEAYLGAPIVLEELPVEEEKVVEVDITQAMPVL